MTCVGRLEDETAPRDAAETRARRRRAMARRAIALAVAIIGTALVSARGGDAAADVEHMEEPRGRARIGETNSSAGGFVRVVDANAFARGECDSPFVFAGFNAYGLGELGADFEDGAYMFGVDRGQGRRAATRMLDAASDAGMNAARVWAFSVNERRKTWRRNARGELEHDEAFLTGLDWVVGEASKRQMVLILALADHWHTTSEFLAECVGDADADMSEFYERVECREMYVWHASKILMRYRDEPAVGAYNLINEPRCRGCDESLQRWIDWAAPFVKTLAPNQLLTIGEEGFYAAGEDNARVNPASWAGTTGQDFNRNHASSAIDFAALHVWRDNWAVYSPSVRFDAEAFTRRWIAAHERDARMILRKPLVVEEFGAAPGGARALARTGRQSASMWTSRRDERGVNNYYRGVFSQVKRNLDDTESSLRGALFWGLFPESMRAEVDKWDPFAVYPSDGAFELASRFAQSIESSSTRATSCNDESTR